MWKLMIWVICGQSHFREKRIARRYKGAWVVEPGSPIMGEELRLLPLPAPGREVKRPVIIDKMSRRVEASSNGASRVMLINGGEVSKVVLASVLVSVRGETVSMSRMTVLSCQHEPYMTFRYGSHQPDTSV